VITFIVWAIIVGAIVGALGRLVVPGRQNLSIALTIVIGIVAAIVGGLIAGALHAGTIVALIIEVALAAVGVALVTGGARSRSRI